MGGLELLEMEVRWLLSLNRVVLYILYVDII